MIFKVWSELDEFLWEIIIKFKKLKKGCFEIELVGETKPEVLNLKEKCLSKQPPCLN